jgi:hypothetical protein
MTRAQDLKLDSEWLMLNMYCNVDFTGNTEDCKLVSGYAMYLGISAVSWSLQKQSTVALSSTEVEYIALLEVV